MILLLAEFLPICPPDVSKDEWAGELNDVSGRLTETCRTVDPTSTQKALEQAAADAVEDLDPM